MSNENCQGNRHRTINCATTAVISKCDGQKAFLGRLYVLQAVRASESSGEAQISGQGALNTASEFNAVNLVTKTTSQQSSSYSVALQAISTGRLALTALV